MHDVKLCTTHSRASSNQDRVKTITEPLQLGYIVALVYELSTDKPAVRAIERKERKWCIARLLNWDLEEDAKTPDRESQTAEVRYLDNYADKVKMDNSHELKEMWYDPKKKEWAAMGGNLNRTGRDWTPMEDWVTKDSIVWWSPPEKVTMQKTLNNTWQIYKLNRSKIKQIQARLKRFDEIKKQVEAEKNTPQSNFSATFPLRQSGQPSYRRKRRRL